MKGLLKKDYELLMGNYRTYLVVLMIALVYLLMGGKTVSFFVGYVTMIFTLLVLTTISYDDFDRGMSFLMTLPVTRRTYVKEKYVFGLCSGYTGWLAGAAVGAVRLWFSESGVDWAEWIAVCSAFLVLVALLLMVMLPIQFRFGGDSGRVVLIGAVMAAFVIGFFGVKLLSALSINLGWIVVKLKSIHLSVLVTFGLIAAVLGMFLSYRISLSVVEKKEY